MPRVTSSTHTACAKWPVRVSLRARPIAPVVVESPDSAKVTADYFYLAGALPTFVCVRRAASSAYLLPFGIEPNGMANHSRGVIEIFLKFARRAASEPYGEGFWSERFRFLDYTGSRFIEVQEQLLMEQLQGIGSVPVAGPALNSSPPRSMTDFMRSVPLTSVDDYASSLNALRQSPRGRNYTWAYTLYGPGQEKWIPYTQRGLKVFADNIIGALGMAADATSSHTEIRPGAKAVYNVPPRPYLAGIAAFELTRRFGLRGVVDPGVTEGMEFEERISEELRAALSSGVDILISMTSVLRRISERFAEGISSGSHTSQSSPGLRGAARYTAAVARAKLSGRRMRPQDLWKPKAILGWGLDTRHFRSQIARDWGRPPFEMYASTEGGTMGLQYRSNSAIAVNPEACFFEFLPESEIEAVRNDPRYLPQTALLPDVSTDGRYEVVITSFYGMPFMRYRTGHMVMFSAGQLGYGPDMAHVGRADDRLDIGGFTRIDESTIWKAISSSGAAVSDWIVRRETNEGNPVLHMYAEPNGSGSSESGEAQERRVHNSLIENDPLYADLVNMLRWHPFRLTQLSAGTFSSFYDEMRNAGEELLARRPQRINAPDATVARLLALSEQLAERRAA